MEFRRDILAATGASASTGVETVVRYVAEVTEDVHAK
jgi:hypothetical protein